MNIIGMNSVQLDMDTCLTGSIKFKEMCYKCFEIT